MHRVFYVRFASRVIIIHPSFRHVQAKLRRSISSYENDIYKWIVNKTIELLFQCHFSRIIPSAGFSEARAEKAISSVYGVQCSSNENCKRLVWHVRTDFHWNRHKRCDGVRCIRNKNQITWLRHTFSIVFQCALNLIGLRLLYAELVFYVL